MSAQIELHGRAQCPFAWRTRLAAFEKGVEFEYIAFDDPAPDPRASKHNPNKRSPLLVHGQFVLTESVIIAQYIDEAFRGRALVPLDAQGRAKLRVDIAELAKLEADTRPGVVATEEVRTRSHQAYEVLNAKLADGRRWLGGDSPGLADLVIWPNLSGLHSALNISIAPSLTHATAYWARAQERESYRETRPR